MVYMSKENNKNIKLVPTLLTHSFSEFKEKLNLVAPYFKLVQIDCMDNKFVKNKTFYDLSKIKTIRTYLNYELHLMVAEPLKLIKKWQNFKKVKKIIFHYEAMKNDEDIFDLIKYLKKRKFKVGLAINPETKLNQVEKFIPKIDVLFLLGVKPGWGGQVLRPSILNKAKQARQKYPKLDIEIDGGVNLNNIAKVAKSGVNIIAAGTMFFEAENVRKIVNQIKNKIKD
ncbi:MAG: ribulose-phosphate 3-epimerase [Candidatus Buchananbacteria bacterium]|nr:ribulose-phosphate 3-epimerase [Candidatus Buchananbacteria bacterium]